MASKFFASFGLLIVFCASEARGRGTTCESFDAVSAAGTLCVLERNARGGRPGAYTCAASEIAAEGFSDWVETDECVAACALDRGTVGISSDALLDADFMRRLCSPDCYYGCPNVLDLYFNLAAAEGRSFPVCVKRDVRMLAEKWRRSEAVEQQRLFAYPPCNVC